MVEPVREAGRESRETTFDDDIADRAELEAILRAAGRASCARACSATSARGRTIAIKVRLDDWTTVTRARTLARADQRRGDDRASVALELLRDYAPPRPVRLLGVRVAGFEDEAVDPSRARRRPASSCCRSPR